MLEKIERQSGIFGKFLYFFAGYTLTIKYILPVSWALIQRVSLTTYIYFWDAWWIAHLLVGYGLAAGKKGIWPWAFLLSAVEIIIITVKFVLYFKNPDFDFWHLNWFVNKALMLIFFWVLLAWLFKKETRKLL